MSAVEGKSGLWNYAPAQPAGGSMSDTPKFDFREWLVPPVLLPVFLGLLIAAAVVIQW
jgi:hypothetical protein